MFKKLTTILTTLTLGASLLTGCSSNTTTTTNTTTEKVLDKITVAEVAHSVFYAPQYAAITNGFFKDEGLDVSLMNANGADKTMAALISGEAQIGLMGPEASIYVYNQGSEDYAINFAQLTKRDGSFLVARKEMPNFKYSDLKGSEILGGRKGGVPLMTFEYVLKKNGLTIAENEKTADVNVRTDVAFAAMAGAFVAGEADYTTVFEPTGTEMEKAGTGYIVASIGADSGEIPYTAYSATKSYINANSDIIQRFTNAVYRGQQWVKTATSEEVAKAMQPFFDDLSLNDLISVVDRYKSIDAWSETPVLTEESLNNLLKVMKEAGELEKDPVYKDIVDTNFAQKAIDNIK
jgi:NitT/TauT family transport system substrate-binding protein